MHYPQLFDAPDAFVLVHTRTYVAYGGMLESNASSSTDWASHELGHARLADRRLVKRLTTIATNFAQHPTAAIPQACGSWKQTKAAYRFFDNDTVEPEAILAAHGQATVQRMQAHPVVLCAQDTTTLNYSTHPQTRGLGPISNNRDKTLGLLLHSTLALSPAVNPWDCSTPRPGRVRAATSAAPPISATARPAPRRKARSG